MRLTKSIERLQVLELFHTRRLQAKKKAYDFEESLGVLLLLRLEAVRVEMFMRVVAGHRWKARELEFKETRLYWLCPLLQELNMFHSASVLKYMDAYSLA
ncbi:hypothetical protein Tco_0078901 [Tanacetum coccineum]